jgi:hypothetical protein
MRKLTVLLGVTIALLFAGLLSWKAEATTPGTAGLPALVKDYSLIQKAACGAVGKHCPRGYVWTCQPSRCWCARC